MKTIAVIDDDLPIGDMLEKVLRGEGYGVLRAYSGTEAVLLLEKHRPDLVLLDLMLPGLSGEEVLPRVRGIPVIVVSAKADPCGKAELLLEGASDYVTKPFSLGELLARITVQLRGPAGAALAFGELCLDPDTFQAEVAGVPVHLTKTEFALLKQLLQNPRQVSTKSRLLDLISGDTPDCTELSLKVHMSNLRKKLRVAGGGAYIEAVWGIGFKLREPDAE